jgi:hypothetical protein
MDYLIERQPDAVSAIGSSHIEPGIGKYRLPVVALSGRVHRAFSFQLFSFRMNLS